MRTKPLAFCTLVMSGCMSADMTPEEKHEACRRAELAAAAKMAADAAASTGTPYGAIAAGVLSLIGTGISAWNHSRINLLLPSPLDRRPPAA